MEDWRSWSQWNQKAQREWKDWKGGWREWSGAGDKDLNRHTHVLAASCIVQYASEQSQICLKEEWSKKQRQGRQKRCSRGLARLLLTDVDHCKQKLCCARRPLGERKMSDDATEGFAKLGARDSFLDASFGQ